MSRLNLCIQDFVDTLIAMGVQHIVVSPGSRNFPIIHACTKRKEITIHSVIDERSAGFHALGMSMALNQVVAVCCTSGTASVNYYPAVAEAFYAKLPLLVLTADRPPEHIDNWEGQAIRQANVFANHICGSLTTPDNYTARVQFKHVAEKAMHLAKEHVGPVHVNIPLREPFYEDVSVEPLSVNEDKEEEVEVLNEAIPDIPIGTRMMWLNGYNRASRHLNYPEDLVVFSDVLANTNETVPNWEVLMLNQAALSGSYAPQLIITTGRFFVSKALRRFLERFDILHWHIGEEEVPEPFGVKPILIRTKAENMLEHIRRSDVDSAYSKRWFELASTVQDIAKNVDWQSYNETTVTRYLYEQLPEDVIVHGANSMPIRLLGLQSKRLDVQHYGNRGTSGIDGCISTALGFAKVVENQLFVFSGDLSFFYDVNAFFTEVIPTNLKVIVLNNGGGGIFELIDGPMAFKQTLAYQTTDHNRTAAHVAQDFGLAYFDADDWPSLKQVLPAFIESKTASILEVKTERTANRSIYKMLKQLI